MVSKYQQKSSPRTLRTGGLMILVFAAVFLLFGSGMFQRGSLDANVARDLQATGLHGVVTDARANVGKSNGDLSALRVELTFMGDDGATHTMNTNHFPYFHPAGNGPIGWHDEFPTKAEIVGQDVLYRVGESPAVDLVSEIPDLVNSGWGFPNYLGLAFMVMGVGAVVGGAAVLVRAARRSRSEKY